jgi:hypothetical protein
MDKAEMEAAVQKETERLLGGRDVWERLMKYGLQQGRPKKVTDGDRSEQPVTLAELGFTKQRMHEARKLAEIPEELFEEILHEVSARGGDVRAILHEYRRRCQQKPQAVDGFLALVRAWNKATDDERNRFFDALRGES